MKRLHFAVALLTALACSSLHAQSTNLRANIPFDFQMGNKLMPAGKYIVECSDHLLVMRTADGKRGALSLTTPSTRDEAPTTGILEFIRYGDDYFFTGVWAPYAKTGGALPKSPRQREIASRAGQSQLTAVVLSSK